MKRKKQLHRAQQDILNQHQSSFTISSQQSTDLSKDNTTQPSIIAQCLPANKGHENRPPSRPPVRIGDKDNYLSRVPVVLDRDAPLKKPLYNQPPKLEYMTYRHHAHNSIWKRHQLIMQRHYAAKGLSQTVWETKLAIQRKGYDMQVDSEIQVARAKASTERQITSSGQTCNANITGNSHRQSYGPISKADTAGKSSGGFQAAIFVFNVRRTIILSI